ncbi:NHX7 [Scenedesmus sp. PABB004]|nr:NHX7 [Scenedesmus sp. PABB004]
MDFCATQNVTYAHRVWNDDARAWCPVPGGGADALLFAGLAVFASCATYSRLSAIWVLMAGGAFQVVTNAYNLNHLSNAITIWLGMHPALMFFMIFLPPLLLDSAARIDAFLFRKMAVHCLLFAFVNVVASTLAFIPIMLGGLGLGATGWRPVDAALFGAMLGSTDAVAVAAVLKAGGAPEMLVVLLEGESLFNDASSLVLFEIFLKLGTEESGGGADPGLGASLGHITQLIAWLAASGAAAGLAMGLAVRLLLRLLQRRAVPPPVEVAISLAGAYTVYLCTEFYIHGSGVIAVVVFGLYGASTFLWGYSSKTLRTNAHRQFWDTLSFIGAPPPPQLRARGRRRAGRHAGAASAATLTAPRRRPRRAANSLVFFYSGSSIMNFVTTSSTSLTGELLGGGSKAARCC